MLTDDKINSLQNLTKRKITYEDIAHSFSLCHSLLTGKQLEDINIIGQIVGLMRDFR